MNKQLFLYFSLGFLVSYNVFSQRPINSTSTFGNFNNLDNNRNDSINNSSAIKVKLSGKTKYTDYKIISHKNDTTFIDTTLTIKKEYKFNYLRKDNFELLPFHNQGQTFNNLAYNFAILSPFPDFGFNAKQFSYLTINDIKYFEVPTPTTEILYKTGLQQGQVLDALFTTNFSRRLNVSLSYKGIRSLGAYRRALVSNGNFRGTFNYKSKNNQYQAKGHLTSQDFFNQENGGLMADDLENFINNNPNFTNRARLDVNLIDSENQFDGTRVYLNHSFKLLAKKDSLQEKDFTNLKIGHVFTSETKTYKYTETTVNKGVFGPQNASGATNNEVKQTLLNNEINLEFNSKYVLGKLRAKLNFTNYSYGYDTILNTISNLNRTKLKGKAISVGADWNAKIKNFKLNASASLTPGAGRLSGNFLLGEAVYKKDSAFSIKASLLISSKSANFNTLLHQSSYDNYNWQNNYSNVNTRDLGINFKSKFINTSLNFTNIDNFTYFDNNNTPQQYDSQITYLKLKANKEFKYRKIALDNTIMYQNISSGSEVLRVPEIITRNTLYYTDYWFKGKPMLVNIGITFKYFTEYYANAYNPILSEFTLQNSQKIGFPTFDVFFNAQVRRTRLFLKVDNATSGFSKKNYFSAPNYPYRDFTIRFGLVWNWFI